MPRRTTLACFALVTTMIVLGARAQTTTAPADPPATGTAPVDPQVEPILDRLEKRGTTVNDLRCNVRQEMKGLTVGEKVVKEGEIKYSRGTAAGTNARFAIHFSKITQDDFPLKPETFVFDGRWFIEARDSTRNVIRREICKPGQKVDLFSIDKSPFPLPFGQKKAEMLRHFDIKLLPTDDKALPTGTQHLQCIPKPGTKKAEEYAEIHFYIDPKVDLPTKIVAHRKTGKKVSEIHTVTFPGLSEKSINPGIPGSEFDFKAPTGWQVSEERLEAPAKENAK